MIEYPDRSMWAWREGAVRFTFTYDTVEVRAIVSVAYLRARFSPPPDGDMLSLALDHAETIEDSVGRYAELSAPLELGAEIRL